MRHHIYLLIFTISSLFFSCKNQKKEKNKEDQIRYAFNINVNSDVKLNNVKLIGNTGELFPIVFIKKGDGYVISSQNSLPLNRYTLIFNNNEQEIPLLIDNSDINLQIDNENFSNSILSGTSDAQKTYNQYIAKSKEAKNLFFYQKEFVTKNKNSDLSAVVLKEMLGKTAWRLGETNKLYETLDEEIKSSKLGKEIEDYITSGLKSIKENPETANNKSDPNPTEVTKPKKVLPKPTKKASPKQTHTQITEYAPYFYANNLSGSEISAKTVFAKNKLILVDFWASWCVPCRAQTPSFLQLYNKYHSKGFEIISVSQDKDSNNCQNAITQDGMKWINLIDNHKAVANMYHVNSIPNTFLVNNQGGILAKDIGPDRLESLLKQHFGF